ncbi:MAG: hypothetical protein KKG59_04265, partial [Nanoarchaeota archaeon]|nr:hypothetical protein [Nanoarchaeota archaeon]
MSKIQDTFQAFLTAYSELQLSADDFDIPSEIVKERRVIRKQFSSMGEELAQRLDPERQKQFETRVYETSAIIHGHHREQIDFLKKQIILNDLKKELSNVESIFEQLKEKQAVNPEIERLFYE